MDFPPLDDTRWDRLLVAVIAQRPTVDDPESPLATRFPSPLHDDTPEPEPAEEPDRTVDLDTYA